MFRGFIEESLPECDGEHVPVGLCAFAGECHRRFALLETGEIKPLAAWYHPLTYARWPACPRRFLGLGHLYRVDQWPVDLAEVCRWAVERGEHRSRQITARASCILREYTRIRETPSALRTRIEVERARNRG